MHIPITDISKDMIEVEEKMQNAEINDKTVEPITELDHKHPLQNR